MCYCQFLPGRETKAPRAHIAAPRRVGCVLRDSLGRLCAHNPDSSSSLLELEPARCRARRKSNCNRWFWHIIPFSHCCPSWPGDTCPPYFLPVPGIVGIAFGHRCGRQVKVIGLYSGGATLLGSMSPSHHVRGRAGHHGKVNSGVFSL